MDMLNFFPSLYEDELLYSAIARYKRMCGMVSKRALERDLFNRKESRKSIFFPIHLGILASKFPPTSKITIKELITDHTMFPFFTAYMSHETTDNVYKAMVEGSSINIENKVGIASSKIKPDTYLKYCPLCYKEDVEMYGESYWRRLPQVPGSIYCLSHSVPFKQSNVLNNEGRLDYVCADEKTCTTEILRYDLPNHFKELNLKYVQCAYELLSNDFERKELSFIISYYIDQLKEKGYASENGSLYMKTILQDFKQFYSPKYLSHMQSDVIEDDPANWVRLFVRNNKKNRSPLRHLLFHQFLGINVIELFNTIYVVGKIPTKKHRTPLYEREKRREEWLRIIKNHPGKSRSELKEIGKGLQTWIYVHDKDWYNEVTPKTSLRKTSKDIINWEKRDEECLKLAKEARKKLLMVEGKPIRIIPSSIRRVIGAKRWFDHKKLVRTREYLDEVYEDIDEFRKRKIIWAIEDMVRQNMNITAYKIQLHAGFGGSNREMKSLILEILEDYE